MLFPFVEVILDFMISIKPLLSNGAFSYNQIEDSVPESEASQRRNIRSYPSFDSIL